MPDDDLDKQIEDMLETIEAGSDALFDAVNEASAESSDAAFGEITDSIVDDESALGVDAPVAQSPDSDDSWLSATGPEPVSGASEIDNAVGDALAEADAALDEVARLATAFNQMLAAAGRVCDSARKAGARVVHCTAEFRPDGAGATENCKIFALGEKLRREQGLVPDQILESSRPHPLGQRRVGLEPSLAALGKEIERLVGGHGADASRARGVKAGAALESVCGTRDHPRASRPRCPSIPSAPVRAERAMIEVLRIENLALVESVELEFGPGLNVLTGETGAGKSSVLSALALLTGARAHAMLGAARGSVRSV